MRAALLFAAAAPLLGCIAPITPMERLQHSANEVAGALRFSRTDIAAEYCSAAAHDAFLARHALWDKKTRVVDLELNGIFLRSSSEAEAILSVSWIHENGAELHTTEISQWWKHEGGSFRLSDEVFRGGDKALFDMIPKKEDPKKAAAAKGATAPGKGTAAPQAAAPAPDHAREHVPDHARFEARTISAE
jgi:hypothetical protein